MRALGWSVGVLALMIADAARAESELGRDPKSRPSRHSRASESSSTSGSSWSSPKRGSGSKQRTGDASRGAAVASTRGLRFWPGPGASEFHFGALVAFDRLQGTSGPRVTRQDGLGVGLTVEAATYYQSNNPLFYVGLGLHATLTYAHLLEDYRPEGADFTSDFRYLTVEADFGPRFMARLPRLGLDFTWGLGLGAQTLEAYESFSNGHEHDELLALGFRIRPYASLATMSRSVFIDVGLNASFGAVTRYQTEYEQVIDGLEAVMATPYLRIGSLWPVGKQTAIGVNYGLEMIGDEFLSTSLSHHLVFLFRACTFWADDGQKVSTASP